MASGVKTQICFDHLAGACTKGDACPRLHLSKAQAAKCICVSGAPSAGDGPGAKPARGGGGDSGAAARNPGAKGAKGTKGAGKGQDNRPSVRSMRRLEEAWQQRAAALDKKIDAMAGTAAGSAGGKG